MSLRFKHVMECIKMAFLCKAECCSITCIDHILFIHSTPHNTCVFPPFDYCECYYEHGCILVYVQVSAFNFLCVYTEILGWPKSLLCIFCKIKDTVFIFTSKFIDLDILSMSSTSHCWLLVGRGQGAFQHSPVHKSAPQQRIIWLKCQ